MTCPASWAAGRAARTAGCVTLSATWGWGGGWGWRARAAGSLGAGAAGVGESDTLLGLETLACPTCLPWVEGQDIDRLVRHSRLSRLPALALAAGPSGASGPSSVEAAVCHALDLGGSRGSLAAGVGGLGPLGAPAVGFCSSEASSFHAGSSSWRPSGHAAERDAPRPATGVAMWTPGRLRGGLIDCPSHPGQRHPDVFLLGWGGRREGGGPGSRPPHSTWGCAAGRLRVPVPLCPHLCSQLAFPCSRVKGQMPCEAGRASCLSVPACEAGAATQRPEGSASAPVEGPASASSWAVLAVEAASLWSP